MGILDRAGDGEEPPRAFVEQREIAADPFLLGSLRAITLTRAPKWVFLAGQRLYVDSVWAPLVRIALWNHAFRRGRGILVVASTIALRLVSRHGLSLL